MFLLYMFVLASYGCYITHNISSMGKFANAYRNLEYESALPSHTMSCVENVVQKDVDKLNEEYVDDYTSDEDKNVLNDGGHGKGTDKGTDKGGGDHYFRPEELAKGRFVKNIKYTYRGMDLRPRRFHSTEPTISELHQNMEKKRILDTLESVRVSIPIKLSLCDYVNKQYLSDSGSCSNLLGGGLLNDGDWDF
jgi:hypothetical protein